MRATMNKTKLAIENLDICLISDTQHVTYIAINIGNWKLPMQNKGLHERSLNQIINTDRRWKELHY